MATHGRKMPKGRPLTGGPRKNLRHDMDEKEEEEMIMIGSIREFKRGMCDATYAIVRSMKNRSDWMLQMAELSPSRELFHDYIGV